MMRWSRRLLILLAGLAALAGLAWLLRPEPLRVELAQVTRGDLEQVVEEDGTTRVRERYVIAAPLAGTLLRINLREGDPVAAGDVVATLVPNPAPLLDPRTREELTQRLGAAEAAQSRAAADFARINATLAQARADLDRTRELAQRGVVARAKLEQDALAVTVAERQLEAARFAEHTAMHEVELARAALARSIQTAAMPQGKLESLDIRAPIGGQVLHVLQKSEAPVALGAKLLEIGDVGQLEIVADILSTEAVGIRAGAPVRIDRWGGPAPLAGRVRLVEPGGFTKISALGVEEQRTNVIIDLADPPEQRASVGAGGGLGDGFRVDVRITLRDMRNVLKLPTSALFRDGGRWMVFRVEGGVARRKEITTQLRTPTETAIGTGLAEGDWVVNYPNDGLTDGRAVSRE